MSHQNKSESRTLPARRTSFQVTHELKESSETPTPLSQLIMMASMSDLNNPQLRSLPTRLTSLHMSLTNSRSHLKPQTPRRQLTMMNSMNHPNNLQSRTHPTRLTSLHMSLTNSGSHLKPLTQLSQTKYHQVNKSSTL